MNPDGEAQGLVAEIGGALAKRGESLAVGETSAGGELCVMVHATAEHARWFRGGIVVYAGSAVPLAAELQEVARRHGIVSKQYVTALAQCVRHAFGCDWALAESGIAGPQTGRRSVKPVGMVCLAVAGPADMSARVLAEEESASHLAIGHCDRDNLWSTSLEFADLGRSENRRRFCLASFQFLRDAMAERDAES